MKKTAQIKIMLISIIFALIGCSIDDSKFESSKDEKEKEKEKMITADLTSQEYFAVEGYVSPININVNNRQYKDSEDFYTQEVNRLTEDVHTKYPGYNLYFDAEIGLRDFKNGMSVFLVASTDSGVASESYVDSKGKFNFSLPNDIDKIALYLLRASKRIGLRLVKDKDTISWCYNFYAENEVALNGKPFILRNFTTTITSYKCEENSNQSITIPENPYNYVVEAFENSDTYNGYGPLPKSKKPTIPAETTPTETTPTETTPAKTTTPTETTPAETTPTETIPAKTTPTTSNPTTPTIEAITTATSTAPEVK